MKAINKTKIIATGLIASFIIGTTTPAFSQDKADNPIEFRVIGSVNDNPIFKFSANNTEEGEFVVKVKDADGNVLYTENVKGINIFRRYRLDIFSEDLNNGFFVRFEVTNVKSNETFVYKATRNSRIVEDIVIAKL